MKIKNNLSYLNKKVFDSISTYNPIFSKVVLGLVMKKKDGKYLDIGCNNGALTEKILLKSRVCETYGIDISQKQLDAAQKRDINTILCDLNEEKELPFPENYFDIVTCLEVIEHILPTDFLLDEIYRILKPEGYAIISTPRLDSLYVISLLILGFQPDLIISISKKKNYGSLWKSRQFHHSGHVSLFTKKAFKEILREHSFQIVKYTSANIFIRMTPFKKDTQIWVVKE